VSPEEAVKVTSLVAELWPQTDLGGTRKAFFANALTGIPSLDDAVRAVHSLFTTERFQPTPAQIIDTAVSMDKESAREWQAIVQAASEIQARRPTTAEVDPKSSGIVWRLCGGLSNLPLTDWRQMDMLRSRFVSEYSAIKRQNLAEHGEQRELTE
jgi:hypothetical protein